MAPGTDKRLHGTVLVLALRNCRCGIGEFTQLGNDGTSSWPPPMRDCPFCGAPLQAR